MDLTAAIKSRKMCRDFRADPIDAAQLESLLDLARRAPSAGFSQGVEFLVLSDRGTVEAYWSTTLTDNSRKSFPWPGLLRAPVLVVVLVRPQAWVERYGRADKASTGLGEGEAAWDVPYWWVDAGAVVQNLLLLAEDAGLGALFFGLFQHESAVLQRFGVPDDWRAVGTVALGTPVGERVASASVRRGARAPIADITHVGRWSRGDARDRADDAPERRTIEHGQ